jgi:hypothetical protein
MFIELSNGSKNQPSKINKRKSSFGVKEHAFAGLQLCSLSTEYLLVHLISDFPPFATACWFSLDLVVLNII